MVRNRNCPLHDARRGNPRRLPLRNRATPVQTHSSRPQQETPGRDQHEHPDLYHPVVRHRDHERFRLVRAVARLSVNRHINRSGARGAAESAGPRFHVSPHQRRRVRPSGTSA